MKDRKNNKKRTGSNSRPSSKKFSARPSFSKQASVDAENIVIGRNPVLELIKSGRTVEKIYIANMRVRSKKSLLWQEKPDW